MLLEAWIQYGFMAAAIIALVIKWRGMARYIPVAFFANWYAIHVCLLAMNYYHLWTYPTRVIPFIEMSVPANDVVIPILAMFWVRYIPVTLKGKILWILSWSIALTIPEYFAERYTGLIAYRNGYDWYYTLVLWLITFPIFYGFHVWFWNFYSSKHPR